MIRGVGTDIIEIERVRKACEADSFFSRIFSERERGMIGTDLTRAADNFAAKEAVAKAFGCGFSGIHPSQIEILRDDKGAPYVELNGSAKQKAGDEGIGRVLISISNTDTLALAFAVCESAEADAHN